MKKQTSFLFLIVSTVSIGVFVFFLLTYAQGIYAELPVTVTVLERPIGDSLTYKLLSVSSSNALSDIEKDLQLTELRGLENDLMAAEDVFRK